MKVKKLAAIIALLGIAAVGAANPSWVEFTRGAEGEAPALTVLESSFAGTTINLKTFGMWVEDVEENAETYQRITLPASHTSEVGKPMLPVVNRLVAIPATAGVQIKVESKDEIVLKDYLVYPAQIPETDSGPKPPFTIDEEFYALDTVYPIELSEVSAPAIMNDVRLVHLSIKPFRYNPKTKELTIATDLTIRLDYSGIDERNQLKQQPSYFDPQWKRLYRSMILNFDDIYGSAKINDVVLPCQYYILYLIIYAHDFRPQVCPKLAEFIEWKTLKGCYVDAVDLNSIPGIDGQTDDVEDVKDYIYDWAHPGYAYPGPVSRYVLLVGDAPIYDPSLPEPERYWPVQCADNSHVPTYAGYTYYYGTIYSDYYYQLMTEDDYPDFCIGRWCPESHADLETYVAKTFAYEQTPVSNWDVDEAILVAWQSSWYRSCKEDIDDEILSPLGYDPLTEYGDQGGTNAGIIGSIEDDNGLGIVNYRGHGLWQEWDGYGGNGWNGSEHFTNGTIHSLSNTNRYPVVYNVCCSNGCIPATFDGNDPAEVVVEAWTRDPNGGGVGALGASRPSASPANHVFDRSLFRAHFDHALNCGMAINFANTAAIDTFPPSGLENAKMYYWIGDPELDVWRGQPQEAYAEYYAVIGPGDPHLEVTVRLNDGHQTPVEGAQVCIHKDGEYHAVSYTISSGRAYLPLPPSGSSVVVTNQKGPICIIPIMDVFYLEGGFSMDVEESVEIVNWQLKPIYPNPMRSSATISYSVCGQVGSSGLQSIRLSVFDISGREVKTLVSSKQKPGHYTVTWNGRDANGARCANGVYFVKMHSWDFNANERLILIR